MTHEYEVRFVRPSGTGNFAEAELKKACDEMAHGEFRLINVQPVISDAVTVAWMLFFERSL